MNKKISIIIPCLNEEKNVRKIYIAIKKKFKVFIASEVVGTCNKNELELWRRPNTRFFSRIKSIYKSKNFIANEVLYFQLAHFGLFALLKHFIGVFIIILSPKIYYKLSKINYTKPN